MTDPPTSPSPPAQGPTSPSQGPASSASSSPGPTRHTDTEAVPMAQLIARSSLGARDARKARARVRVQDARQVMARAASIRHRKSGG